MCVSIDMIILLVVLKGGGRLDTQELANGIQNRLRSLAEVFVSQDGHAAGENRICVPAVGSKEGVCGFCATREPDINRIANKGKRLDWENLRQALENGKLVAVLVAVSLGWCEVDV